jgi:hypothetical protein
METSRSTIQSNAKEQMQAALAQVKLGEFVELSRHTSDSEVPIIAFRFVGDMDKFKAAISSAIIDATKGLSEGHWITVKITE